MKTVVATVTLSLACFSAFAQGTLDFANSWDGLLNAPDYLSDGQTKLSGPEFVAELMAGPSPAMLASFGTASFGTGSRAGYFYGGSLNINTVGCGGIAFIQLNVWNTNAGVTFSEAQASGMANAWGQTGIFPVRTSGGKCCDPPCVANPLTGLPSVSLNSFPEPQLRLALTNSNALVISWSAAPGVFGVEETRDLGVGNWIGLTNTLMTAGSRDQLIVVPMSQHRFYRLASRPTAFSYTVTNEAITITAYTGAGGAVEIPPFINSLPVTSIGQWAFYGSTNLTSIKVPNSVTNIADSAFESCTSLTNATLGSGVNYIGQFAFSGCSALVRMTIPDSVIGIGPWAFWQCSGMHDVTIGNGIESIGFEAFSSCTNLGNVAIGARVTTIGDYAFQSCLNLTNVSMGTNVSYIGLETFQQCVSLTSITIPKSVTSIGSYAFGSCTNLTSIFFKGNAPSIGTFVFSGDDKATVYYLAGTLGWGTVWAGRPTLLWNPTAQTSGVKNGQFGFNTVGPTNLQVLVQGSTKLAGGDWATLQANALTNGLLHFSDSGWNQHSTRLYRLTH